MRKAVLLALLMAAWTARVGAQDAKPITTPVIVPTNSTAVLPANQTQKTIYACDICNNGSPVLVFDFAPITNVVAIYGTTTNVFKSGQFLVTGQCYQSPAGLNVNRAVHMQTTNATPGAATITRWWQP